MRAYELFQNDGSMIDGEKFYDIICSISKRNFCVGVIELCM